MKLFYIIKQHISTLWYFLAFSILFSLLLSNFRLYLIQRETEKLQQNYTKIFQESSTATNTSSAQFKAQPASETSTQLQGGIAKNIIRFHVIANSNSVKDQSLKYALRDYIIHSVQETVSPAASPAQAKKIIQKNIGELHEKAAEFLSQNNCHVPVKVSLKKRYFPVKLYGDLTFPAGDYTALCIEIGKAQGRNWWCVLFPSLCFVDETTATVPDASKEKLKKYMTKQEYDSLTSEPAVSPSAVPSKKRITPSTTPLPKKKPAVRFALWDFITGK